MNKSTILIAEDNTINRQILIKLLGDEYDILEAVDGQEAMDILEVKMDDIAALLLDIVMPNKNGYEVLEWLKEKGKLGGQHKIPRLSNQRTYIEELLELNK